MRVLESGRRNSASTSEWLGYVFLALLLLLACTVGVYFGVTYRD